LLILKRQLLRWTRRLIISSSYWASSDHISEAITVTEEFGLSEGILHFQTSDGCGIRVLAIAEKNRKLYRRLA
jgi:hypothetical protein